MSRLELLLDSNRGIYIPRDFSQMNRWIYPPEYNDTLSDPNNESYWDVWESVLNNAYYVDTEGHRWTLHQDGDLWAVRSDLYDDTESKEFTDFFGDHL